MDLLKLIKQRGKSINLFTVVFGAVAWKYESAAAGIALAVAGALTAFVTTEVVGRVKGAESTTTDQGVSE